MSKAVQLVTGAVAAAGAMAIGGLLLGTGASNEAIAGKAAPAHTQRQAQMINIQAITMTPRETIGCPAAPHPVCESRPGRVGKDAQTPDLFGALVDAEGTSVAPVQVPAGSRIVRVEVVGADTQPNYSNSAEPHVTAMLTRYRIGEGERSVAVALVGHGVEKPRRFVSGAPNRARAVVRADSSYYIQLTIPRAAPGTFKAVQMVRVVYRPAAK